MKIYSHEIVTIFLVLHTCKTGSDFEILLVKHYCVIRDLVDSMKGRCGWPTSRNTFQTYRPLSYKPFKVHHHAPGAYGLLGNTLSILVARVVL